MSDETPSERAFPAAARVAADAVRRHEHLHHRAPPRPIPPYLWPVDEPPVAGESLVMVATAEEWLAIAALVAMLDEVPPGANVRTLWRDGSPWLEIAVVTGADPESRRVEKFALWRYTLAIYRLGADGAVEDDPIWQPAERTA
jgi:hypothetical protein